MAASDPRPSDPQHSDDESLARRILSIPVEIVVALYILLDSIVGPLFGPIMRGLSRLQLVRRLERAILALPAYVILVLLVVPFGIAELTKVYALVLMGEGHFHTGMTMFIGAYVVSILVCERTFHAGKPKLMTIGWFAVAYNWFTALRDRIMDWLRGTRTWQAMGDLRQRARLAFRRIRVRFRALSGAGPRGLTQRR